MSAPVPTVYCLNSQLLTHAIERPDIVIYRRLLITMYQRGK
jgi:hypothetical protein